MEETKMMLAKAQRMLAADKPDKEEYSALQNFVLKHNSALRADADFAELKTTLGKIASRYGLPTLESIQENFGLNSCAQ